MISKDLQARIDQWFDQDYRETFLERIWLVLESEALYAKNADAISYGRTLEHILKGISVVVKPGEKILGDVKTQIPTEAQEQKILEVYRRWWDIATEERHKKILFYYSEGWLKCRPYWFPSFGHLALDWEAILNEGLGAMTKKAKERLMVVEKEAQKVFLQGVILCYEAISDFILRYAKEAQVQGMDGQAADLFQIAKGPAKSFYQALQLIWLVTLVCQKVCGCGVLNFSRMDQYLYPYYQNDRNKGRITKTDALGLIHEFYFKNNAIMTQTDHMSQEVEATAYTLEVAYDDPNYLTLGGQNADGSSGVNELSFLMVEAAKDLRLRNPFIVVRYHAGIDTHFWRVCCDAMRANTTLVIYNDDTMIPALKRYGVEEPEVYEYGFYGCNDPNIPADEGGLRQLWINLVKPLELALQRGDYPIEPRAQAKPRDFAFSIDDRMTGVMTGAYYGIESRELSSIKTMADFLEVYEEQLTYLISEFRRGFEHDFAIEQTCTMDKMRIEDCFLRGTIDDAVTWTEGGTKYHKIVTQGCGVATVIDALYVMEQVVFVKKEMTLLELADMMKHDYAGYEMLAQRFHRKFEKFGNDIDEVDKYAQMVTDIFVRATEKYNGNQYLYQMWPTYSTDRGFTTMGACVGATPDGRRAKEQISENQSPSEGADRSGLTAMLNSAAKLFDDKITGGPLNVRIHPSAVAGEDGLDALCALFKTYMQKGGLQIQLNVVDVETLREAQANPEKYKTLCVRVTGYSAFFVEMGEQAQNELIKRTEQSV